MVRTFTLSAAALALAAVLPAQQDTRIAVELSTAEASGVHANRQIDAVRAGTVADRPIVLRAADGRTAMAHSVARRELPSRTNPDGLGAAFDWGCAAAAGDIAGTLGGNPLTAGAQHYALVLRADQSVAGRLLLLFDGHVRGNAAANAAVVVGQTGKRFVADGTRQRDTIANLTVGPRGLRVAVYVSGRAAGDRSGPAAFGANLKVLFMPDGGGGSCQVLPGQRSCPEGGILRGAIERTPRGPVLALGLSGALPDAIGLTLVSPIGRTFPIGSTNCIFFQQAILHDVFRTDANGNARSAVPIPMRVGSFFVQQGTVVISPRGIRLGTSNTLEVRCN